MIKIDSVSKSFNNQCIIDNISLEIEHGGMTSLIGPNGAGKSTLLSMMSRLLPMDSGSISVDGLDVNKTAGAVLAQKLSILRQDNSVNCRLTVHDLVSFGRYPYSKGRLNMHDKEHIEKAISYLGLETYQDKFLDELSGGQRQRAFIAMILCQDTDYILLDEPLNNLDMKHSVSMMKLLKRAVHELGKTVVIVLHDINFASCYSDSIIAMKQGQVIAKGSAETIMQSDCLRSVYDTDITIKMIDDRPIAVYYT